MTDVVNAVDAISKRDGFCSVEEIGAAVAELRSDPSFKVDVVGESKGGRAIPLVRFGSGRLNALFVAGPHVHEPIGGLTSLGLINLLRARNSVVTDLDVTWNIIPCIDPDGAVLNEGWTTKRFTPLGFMRNFYLQPWSDQVDTSFPIRHKNLIFDSPSHEARLLRDVVGAIKPDFYMPLHNCFAGGAWFPVSHNLGEEVQTQIRAIVRHQGIPIRSDPQFSEFLTVFGEGFIEKYSITKHYDFLESLVDRPQDALSCGGASWDYLAEIKPDALIFTAECGHFDHPASHSEEPTEYNLRDFKLREAAAAKFLATVVYEEWQKVRSAVNPLSPFFKVVTEYVAPSKNRIRDGGVPITRSPTADILFNPSYSRPMTKREMFDICVVNEGLKYLAINYQFLRLLDESGQTDAIKIARERVGNAFDRALNRVSAEFPFSEFQTFRPDKLAKVQLGSGLTALMSLLR